MSFPLPEDEAARLKCLHRYNILDTPAEQAFDDITRLASYICGTPISVISLLDETRQWFKSSVGLETTETPRDQAFCTHAILQDGLMVVPNALEDGRFAANPLVTGAPHIRFYAGAPLVTASGQALGTLCVIDRVPRTLTPEQAEALCALSRQVVALLELRRTITEHKRTLLEKERFEQELRISMRMQQAIFDSAGYAFISTNPQGVIQTFNRAAERMLGYSAEEVIGKVTPAILHDADEVAACAEILTQELGRNIAPGFEVFTAKIREGTPDESEWTYIRKDGSRFPIRLSATALRNEDGALTGYLGIAQDITARRQAELALQKSQEQLEAAQQIARMGSWEYDLATQKIIWSKELFRLFGLAPEQGEPEYTGAVSLYAPEDAARLDGCFQRALNEGIGYEMDLQGAISVGGAPRWYHTVGEPVFDAQGKLLRLAGTLVDITKRKQVEEAMQSNEERFRLLTEVVKDYAIFALDTQGRVVTWNVGAANLKGYSAEEIIGRHFSVFYPQDVAVEQIERKLEQAHTDGRYEEEGWRVRKDGTRFWANVTITPMWDAKGRLHGYSKVTRDMTAHKQAAETICALHTAMEQASEGISHLDTEGCYTSVNEAYANAVGYSAVEMIGMIWLPTVHPDDHTFMLAEYARMKAEGKTISEVRGVRKDGGEFFKQITMVRELDAEGRFIGHYCFMKNITEHKQAEETLSRSEARLQEAQQVAKLGSWEYDLVTGKITWSHELFRLLDLDSEQGEPDYVAQLAFYHPEDAARLDACVQQAIATGKDYSLDLQRAPADGQAARWYNAVGKAVRNAAGTIIQLVGTLHDITERKEIEQALEEASELLEIRVQERTEALSKSDTLNRAVLNSLHAHVAILDREGTIQVTNAAWERFAFENSIERNETIGIGNNYLTVCLNSLGEAAPEASATYYGIKAVLDGVSDQYTLEYPCHSPQEPRWFLMSVVPLAMEAGGAVVSHMNITARKQTEDALIESEKRYRFLADAMPQIVWTSSPDGNVDYYNQRWFDYTGMTLEETRDQGWQPILHSDDLQNCVDRLTHSLTTGERMEVELRLKGASEGGYRWHLARSFPRRNDAGEIIQWIGTSTDIEEAKQAQAALLRLNEELEERVQQRTADLEETNRFLQIENQARREAELALRKQEELLRLFVRHCPVAVAMFDHEMRYVAMSDYWLRDYGLGERNVVGQCHYDLFPDLPDQWKAIYQHGLAGNTESSEEDPFIGLDGSIEWLQWRCLPWYSGNGEVGGILLFSQFVTQRKRDQEILKQQAQELARSNDELQQFAYVASHDLQEPLRMVGSYTQLLARRYQGRLDDRADQYIAYAVDGVTRMQTLIRDLLAYSRVGSQERILQPTGINKVLDTAMANLKATLEDNAATITVDLLPTVMADEAQMVSLFQNLIGNALKYHGDEPPHIYISAVQQEGEWRFAVKDNGIGIDPQFAERIFVIFQRLHGREEYSGTGIGLSICKKIVEHHNGRIWMESEPGKGSTFFFTLRT